MPFSRILLAVFLGLVCYASQAQARLHSKKVAVDSCSIEISPYTLIPETVTVYSSNDTISGWSLNNNYLVLGADGCERHWGDTLVVVYRVFGFDIEKPVYNIDSSLLAFKEKIADGGGFEYRQNTGENTKFDAGGLDYRGSFTRGFSLGNSQSLVLNSNFDMQLVGDLGNGLKVVAAISDENLPIQAQGNTQQLQEFDKVFIRVSKDKTSVTAGDYELRRPESYFMNYFKKAKGISLATRFDAGKGTQVFTQGSFAISRGKFARQTLETSEGNQGPYRLQGNNNERFIIVLAGTEKVYFNGNLLTRGYDYDYTIDYNRAEVTFSPTRVISRDSRVVVEFEYTDISYFRSLYATRTEFSNKKWNINFNIYSEQDSKNATGDVQLDSTDVRILELSGDDLSKSVRSGIRVLTPEQRKDINAILYAATPDPLDPSHLILRFTENIDSAAYTAVFTEVGPGNGDYVIDTRVAKNGRVYRYAGKNMGSYQPIVQLIPPEQRQMITLNGTYHIGRNTSVYAEMGLSHVDQNRLSRLDNGDNTGMSSFLSLDHKFKLDTAAKWMVTTSLKHEFVNKNFQSLNPYRATEFVRDWNIAELMGKGDENLVLGSIAVQSRNGISLSYDLNTYSKAGLYSGFRHKPVVELNKKRWTVKGLADYLVSESWALDQETKFLRPNFLVGYKLSENGNWMTGVVYDGESNHIKSILTDTLAINSNAYDHFKWYLSNDFSKDFGVKVGYSVREDYLVSHNALGRASTANEIELASKWTASVHSDLNWSIIGRQLKVNDTDLLPNESDKRTILGKIDYLFTALNQGVRSSTSYNTNSGQEPKVEYVFQKVDTGQGDYVFIGQDENPNLSNLQDFRFDPSNPARSYIRLSLTNNEFIRTNNIEFNQSLNIEPSKFKKPKEGEPFGAGYRFLSRFSTVSTFRISKKQMDDATTTFGSFIDFGLEDSSLVSYTSILNNTLFFNKGNVKYDIQIGNRNNQGRTLQVGDMEDRGINETFFRSRVHLGGQADAYLAVEKTIKTYSSVIFSNRDLDIKILSFRPELNYRPSGNIRLIARYSYQDKKQQILTKDVAFVNDFTGEFSWRKANLYSLDFSMSLVLIKFSGEAGSPLEYDMLDGLKDGRNLLWNTVFTRRVGKNIDLTFNYEGRKAGISPVIHVGRAQLKATF